MRTRERAPRHQLKRGKEIVVKELKDSYTWDAADWDVTLRIHKKASQLSRGFNSFPRTNYPIRFTEITVHNVYNQSTDPISRPKLDESVIVEEYIAGEFNKWCSNYGFISAESQSMPAFMHWSWVHTRGEMMVGDLQGVWKPDREICRNGISRLICDCNLGKTKICSRE